MNPYGPHGSVLGQGGVVTCHDLGGRADHLLEFHSCDADLMIIQLTCALHDSHTLETLCRAFLRRIDHDSLLRARSLEDIATAAVIAVANL